MRGYAAETAKGQEAHAISGAVGPSGTFAPKGTGPKTEEAAKVARQSGSLRRQTTTTFSPQTAVSGDFICSATKAAKQTVANVEEGAKV